MALAFDNAAFTAGTASSGVRVLLLTATAGAVLVIGTVTNETVSMSAVAAGGVACTRLGATLYNFNSNRIELWGLTAPASGTLTISARTVGNNTQHFLLIGATYTGQKTDGSPFGEVILGSAQEATTLPISISCDVGGMSIALFGAGQSPISVGASNVRVNHLQAGFFEARFVDRSATAAVEAHTASAALSLQAGVIGLHLIPSGASVVTGRLSATEALDTFAATGNVFIHGTGAATDTPDAFSARAAVRITAFLSATDAGADTFSAPAQVRISGLAAFTDAPDTLSASGYTLARATFAATDAPDTFSASGYVLVQGTFNATDAPDTFVASGTVSVASSNITGVFAATDAPDTFSAPAYVVVAGLAAFTDSPDTFSASATVVALSVSSPPVAIITTDPGAGHGKRSNNKPPYIPAPRDFWDARERYLKTLHPELEAEPEPAPEPAPELVVDVPRTAIAIDPTLLPSYRVERNQLVKAIPAATSMRQLRAAGDRLRQVNAAIAQQKRLELDAAKAQEKRRRLAAIRKQRKLLNALLIANTILKLYFQHLR